ncbi:hypothetical protein RYX36_006776 [Vicia faba]
MKARYPKEEQVPREFINLTNSSDFTKVYNRLMLIKMKSNEKTYWEAIGSTYNKQLCIYICCMINEISSEFLTSVITALDAIGIKPDLYPSKTYYPTNVEGNTYVCPTDNKLRIELFSDNHARGLSKLFDWPTILVIFGCCILVLFNKFTTEENYKTFMTNSIAQLRERARCDPDVNLDIPFNFKEANAIKTMIGPCSMLCNDSICFLLKHMNCQNSGIGLVCQYLGNELAWLDMHHLVLMNDLLIAPQSPVLGDPRVLREVESLSQAIAKVSSHSYPQFYMFMVSNLERLKTEPSMFPTLIAVAQVLERGDNNVTNLESSSTKAANLSIVQSLVTLHQTTFPPNRSRTSGVSLIKQEKRRII